MNAFRRKLISLKQRLSDRRMYSITLLVVAIISSWGIYQYKRVAQLRQQLDNQYSRAFYEMTGHINNVNLLITKAMITSTPAKTSSILQDAWRQASSAQTNLGQLPISQPVLANTSKFLAQVGDLSYTLNAQSLQGQGLSDQQYSTLQQLKSLSASLSNSLNDLQSQIFAQRMRWGDLKSKGSPIFGKASSQLATSPFDNVNKNFENYPKLIYDGPFSEHISSITPRGLTGDVISSEQGKEKIKNIFGADKVKSITDTGKNDQDPIKTYSYKVLFNNISEDFFANVDLTQQGGTVLWMLYNRPAQGGSIDINKAKEIGKKFLDSQGFNNMADTYYLTENNVATINYAYEQNNVTIYPDLVKVKVSLDNGEVVGLESKGYLYSHTNRSLPTPKVSMDKARSSINKKVTILSSGLAVIPTTYKTELFVYEFKGKVDDQDFLAYINAENGREEDILVIINTPNGILTM